MLRCVKRVAAILLWLLLPAASGQGSFNFTITITGSEIIGGQLAPVVGTGSLQLFGSSLQYSIFVPVTVLPAETHFHGPRVDSEMPQFSLPPYERWTGGIAYRGSYLFDPKYVPDIKAGKWYINLHSPNYDNAVLTGFILPIPEPAPGGILVIGIILLSYFLGAAPRTRISSMDKARS